jgi:hypothetical protein
MFHQLKPKKGQSGQHLLHQLNPEPSATAAPFPALGLLVGTIGRLYEDTSKLKNLAAARRYTPLPHDWRQVERLDIPLRLGGLHPHRVTNLPHITLQTCGLAAAPMGEHLIQPRGREDGPTGLGTRRPMGLRAADA